MIFGGVKAIPTLIIEHLGDKIGMAWNVVSFAVLLPPLDADESSFVSPLDVARGSWGSIL